MAEHPIRFEHATYLGDKRTQVVYEIATAPQDVIDDIVATGVGLTFGPDTLLEARNRGYKPHSSVSSVTT
jgi:hypothetical protein